MADVFISYKHENIDLVRIVASALSAEGFSVWWDDAITPRESWDSTLEKEIEEATSVLVLWTPQSVDSKWVRIEAHHGQKRGKLVPIRLEACELPLAFSLTQTLNLRGWGGDPSDAQWRKLLIWLADLRAFPEADRSPGVSVANPFRNTIGQLASGEAFVEGAFINEVTPAGTLFQDGPGAPIMRVIPRGRFLMGGTPEDSERSSVELPQKNVHIDHPLAVGIFPVLRSEFEKLVAPASEEALPIKPRGWFGVKPTVPPAPARQSQPDCVVNYVSVPDALAYCSALSHRSAARYRLPSESEWEYACRARSSARYSWGDTIEPSQAWYGLARDMGPIPPGRFRPNAFGLYDMHGNVREWTCDLWRECYDLLPADGRPAMEGHGSMRVTRGGGWSDPPAMLRSSARSRATETMRSEVIGFRVVRDLTEGSPV